MKIYITIYILLCLKIFIICQTELKYSYINNNDFSIKNAVYIIRNRDGNLNLEYDDKYPYFVNKDKKELKQNYLLMKDNNENSINDDYFYIIVSGNIYLSASNESNYVQKNSNMDKDYSLWKIIPKINEDNKLIYYVQNKKLNKYWELESKYIILKEVINFNKTNEFQFVELYKEVERKESNILDKEPIDVLIKYIDISDPNLNRSGINQISKDEDNEELRYSVRSVLQNISWIRKIFILMPNEKVRFFKDPEEINNKIVYVKDKDLLGFDTASPSIFQFHLHKMKKFGLSENFILMDDDYFIARPLKKKRFFYEENGTVYPALITSDYYEMNKEKYENFIKFPPKTRDVNANSAKGFLIKQRRALLFMYKIFGDDDKRNGKKLIEPAFSHNAIPMKISDIEEIHNHIVNYYEYVNITFFSKERTLFDLQMQTLYMAYVKNKYDRKVSKVSSDFYDLLKIRKVEHNTKDLFVINKSNRRYHLMHLRGEKKVLNYLFPEKTIYELDTDENKHYEYEYEYDYDFLRRKRERLKYDNNEQMIMKKLQIIKIRLLKKSKKIKINISNVFNRIDNIVNNFYILINKTKNYQNEDGEIKYKEHLAKEIDFLKKENKLHNRINFFLLCIVFYLLFKVYKYLKKHDNNQLNEYDIQIKN